MMTNKLSRTPTDVVKDADSSDDDVDDLECEVTDVCKIQRQVVICRRGCRDVVPDITRQRCVLHRC